MGLRFLQAFVFPLLAGFFEGAAGAGDGAAGEGVEHFGDGHFLYEKVRRGEGDRDREVGSNYKCGSKTVGGRERSSCIDFGRIQYPVSSR